MRRYLSRIPLLTTLVALGLATVPVPAAERTLTVYTYESFTAEWGPGPKVQAAFEASCDCKLNWGGSRRWRGVAQPAQA